MDPPIVALDGLFGFCICDKDEERCLPGFFVDPPAAILPLVDGRLLLLLLLVGFGDTDRRSLLEVRVLQLRVVAVVTTSLEGSVEAVEVDDSFFLVADSLPTLDDLDLLPDVVFLLVVAVDVLVDFFFLLLEFDDDDFFFLLFLISPIPSCDDVAGFLLLLRIRSNRSSSS